MEKYEDTLKEIEASLGSVPGFMAALTEDVLVKEWPSSRNTSLVNQ